MYWSILFRFLCIRITYLSFTLVCVVIIIDIVNMCETIFLVTVKRFDRGARVTVYFSSSVLNLLLLYQFAVAGCCCCFGLLVVEANLFWCLFYYSVWLYSPYYVILVYLIRLTKSERRQREQFVMHYFLWIWLGIWPHWPSFVDPRVLREWVEASWHTPDWYCKW